MTSNTIANPSHARGDASPALTAALAITAIAAATLAGAWFMQLVLDIQPCDSASRSATPITWWCRSAR